MHDKVQISYDCFSETGHMIELLLKTAHQRRIQNPVKHLGWNILRK